MSYFSHKAKVFEKKMKKVFVPAKEKSVSRKRMEGNIDIPSNFQITPPIYRKVLGFTKASWTFKWCKYFLFSRALKP